MPAKTKLKDLEARLAATEQQFAELKKASKQTGAVPATSEQKDPTLERLLTEAQRHRHAQEMAFDQWHICAVCYRKQSTNDVTCDQCGNRAKWLPGRLLDPRHADQLPPIEQNGRLQLKVRIASASREEMQRLLLNTRMEVRDWALPICNRVLDFRHEAPLYAERPAATDLSYEEQEPIHMRPLPIPEPEPISDTTPEYPSLDERLANDHVCVLEDRCGLPRGTFGGREIGPPPKEPKRAPRPAPPALRFGAPGRRIAFEDGPGRERVPTAEDLRRGSW